MEETFTKHEMGEYWLIEGNGIEVLVSQSGNIETVKEQRGSNWYNVSFHSLPETYKDEIQELI